MNYQINHRADPGYDQFSSGAVVAAETVLKHQNAPAGSLSVVLTSSEFIQDLNETYRGNPEPTDVLSFPDGDRDPETKTKYFGDVIIAVPEAQKQAEQSGHSVTAELNLLVVHGVLHLLGFKHSDDVEKQEMWLHQTEILRQLNNEILEPTESAYIDQQDTLDLDEAAAPENAGDTDILDTNDAVDLGETVDMDETPASEETSASEEAVDPEETVDSEDINE